MCVWLFFILLTTFQIFFLSIFWSVWVHQAALAIRGRYRAWRVKKLKGEKNQRTSHVFFYHDHNLALWLLKFPGPCEALCYISDCLTWQGLVIAHAPTCQVPGSLWSDRGNWGAKHVHVNAVPSSLQTGFSKEYQLWLLEYVHPRRVRNYWLSGTPKITVASVGNVTLFVVWS